jgi:hypothetical protein
MTEENQNEKMNRDVFMNAWVNRYYVEDADDKTGNIDYLKAEGEKEYYIQNKGYGSEYDLMNHLERIQSKKKIL